jgi:predicted esterase
MIEPMTLLLCDRLNGEKAHKYKNMERKDIDDVKDSRYFLYTMKENNKPYDLLLFYHGSCSCAWANVLEYTGLSDLDNIITVYGQASGKMVPAHKHPIYGFTSFGDLYWEIRDCVKGFSDDLAYTKNIIEIMKKMYNIRKIYFIGHSNGGVFALLLAVYMSDIFDAIISHQGGMGFDPHFYVDFRKAGKNKPRMLFYTGTHDIHKQVCMEAHELFLSEGYCSKLYIENELQHTYDKSCEAYMLNFLRNDE